MRSMDAISKSTQEHSGQPGEWKQKAPETLEQTLTLSAAIMARLRGPGGCPWDRDQTFDSIRRYTLEETYEVFDAIDRKDWAGLKDELGDLLLQVLFYAQMAREAGFFELQDVISNLNDKLVRRHPHVFADRKGVETAGQVVANWEEIKKTEREQKYGQAGRATQQSLLDTVLRSLPALAEAEKLGSKAASVGFDWEEADPVFAKLEEELGELRSAIQGGCSAENLAGQQEELGDVLFTVVNLSRKLGLHAELALHASNRKFRRRFSSMERSLDSGRTLKELSSAELEELWNEAKAQERQATAE